MNKIKTFFKNLKPKQKICLIGILIAIIFISILTVIVLSKNHKQPTNQENPISKYHHMKPILLFYWQIKNF